MKKVSDVSECNTNQTNTGLSADYSYLFCVRTTFTFCSALQPLVHHVWNACNELGEMCLTCRSKNKMYT